jgi:nitrogen fixation protein FixH
MKTAGSLTNGLQGRHVLLWLIGFFGLMLIANGIFLYCALATFSGGDTDPYRKGLHYNDTLAAAQHQAEQGWNAALSYDAKAERLALGLTDRLAQPVTGLHIEAAVSRPATDKEDRKLPLEEEAPGVYASEIKLGPGQWVISAATPDEGNTSVPTYQLKQRIRVEAVP